MDLPVSVALPIQAHATAANAVAFVLIGALLACGLLIYLYQARNKARARAATRQQLEADLERRTKELAEVDRQFAVERSATEQQLRLLLRELTHRSKNLLTVIQAIARQTARQTATVDEFLDRFGARLHGIGVSHDLLVADDWQGASLRMLVEQQLEAYADASSEQVSIDGEDVVLKPEAVQNLGMALHELTANAETYGALSRPEGSVHVSWLVCDDENTLKLSWQETGGPEVKKPSRSGFGRAVIENIVSQALSGQATLIFAPKGVRCDIVIPDSHISSRG